MGVKYTFEQVTTIFLSNKCKLLSTNYSKNTDILQFECKCSKIVEMQFKKYLVQKCCEECHSKTLTKKFKYTFQEVKDYFTKHNCKLLSTEYKNQLTNLDYICECGNETIIQFKTFLLGNRCQKCALEKRKKTNIEKYGNEVSMNSDILKEKWVEKVKNRTEEEKEEIKNKRKKTTLKNYGVEHVLQSEIVKEKAKITNLEKYGKEFTLQVEDIRNKGKETMIEKYGCEYMMQHPEIQNIIVSKFKETNLERYGFECSLSNPEILQKSKDTNLEKYGFEYAIQNPEIYQKVKETNLERYGFEYACQNAEVQSKIMKQRMKKYVLPSGKEINIQGYENIALNILLKEFNENEILTDRGKMPLIMYELKNIKRRYFPDIFIPKENKIIEVKSLWTYKRELIKNIVKALYTRKLGYNFEIWIIDKKQIKYIL